MSLSNLMSWWWTPKKWMWAQVRRQQASYLSITKVLCPRIRVKSITSQNLALLTKICIQIPQQALRSKIFKLSKNKCQLQTNLTAMTKNNSCEVKVSNSDNSLKDLLLTTKSEWIRWWSKKWRTLLKGRWLATKTKCFASYNLQTSQQQIKRKCTQIITRGIICQVSLNCTWWRPVQIWEAATVSFAS